MINFPLPFDTIIWLHIQLNMLSSLQKHFLWSILIHSILANHTIFTEIYRTFFKQIFFLFNTTYTMSLTLPSFNSVYKQKTIIKVKMYFVDVRKLWKLSVCIKITVHPHAMRFPFELMAMTSFWIANGLLGFDVVYVSYEGVPSDL